MRILYIIHQFFPEFASGTERVAMNIAQTQQRNGHRVDVLTCSVRGASFWSYEQDGLRQAVVEGVPIFALPRELLGNMAEFSSDASEQVVSVVSRLLERNAYDVAHVMHSMRMLEAIEAIQQRQIPYVMTLTDFFAICYRINLIRLDGRYCKGPANGKACCSHCVDLSATPARIAARVRHLSAMVSNAAEVVACSEFVAEAFREEFPNVTFRVLEHGIELQRFHHRVRNSTDKLLVFGYIGTLSEAKGVHVLIEAFKRAAVRNARLEIIGSPYFNEEFAAQLENYRGPEIAIRDEVPHGDIPGILATFDILCLPSLVPETFSLALHEGFAAGLPALVSNIGWPARVVERASCGRAVQVGDVDAWSSAIAELSGNPGILAFWQKQIPLQARVEEEAFFYDQLYRRAVFASGFRSTLAV
jgi:glycosyltransferase involved in cell wall biosynthesis